MTATKNNDGPSKQDVEKLKRLCSQLVEANKRLERRVIFLDERLRNAQANITQAQSRLDSLSRRS